MLNSGQGPTVRKADMKVDVPDSTGCYLNEAECVDPCVGRFIQVKNLRRQGRKILQAFASRDTALTH